MDDFVDFDEFVDVLREQYPTYDVCDTGLMVSDDESWYGEDRKQDANFYRTFFWLVRKANQDPRSIAKTFRISRSVMCDINCGRYVTVKKHTAMVLAFALRLNLQEAQEFLHLAGYHMTTNIPEDSVFLSAFKSGNYDVLTLNKNLGLVGAKTLFELKSHF